VKRIASITVAACLLLAAIVTAEPFTSVGPGQIADKSNDRNVGIGLQVDLPVFGLVSLRAWWEDLLGVEIVALVFGPLVTVTPRGLVKIADSNEADLYMAFGSTFYPAGGVILHAAAGIEWSPSTHIALNLELGFGYDPSLGPSTFIGGGIHYYF